MFLDRRKRDVEDKPNGRGDMQRYEAMLGEFKYGKASQKGNNKGRGEANK